MDIALSSPVREGLCCRVMEHVCVLGSPLKSALWCLVCEPRVSCELWSESCLRGRPRRLGVVLGSSAMAAGLASHPLIVSGEVLMTRDLTRRVHRLIEVRGYDTRLTA